MEKGINAQEVQVNAADGSIVDSIESKIFNIRGKQVMLDRDLAVHHLGCRFAHVRHQSNGT